MRLSSVGGNKHDDLMDWESETHEPESDECILMGFGKSEKPMQNVSSIRVFVSKNQSAMDFY
jgi:hypothetical protein